TLQWKKLLENAVSFPLHHFQGIDQTIPNFYNNERRSHVVEFKAGAGKLILTGFDMDRGTSLEEKNFKQAIISYMQSDSFEPVNHVSLEQLTETYPFKALD